MNRFEGVNRIIFDLDNTLLKHNGDLETDMLCDILNVPRNSGLKEQMMDFFCNNEKIIKNRLVSKELIANIIEQFVPVLRQISSDGFTVLQRLKEIESISLMPGTIETLSYLQDKGYMLVVSTNWFLDHQTSVMTRLGILNYFERIYSWDNFYPKPDKRAMRRTLADTDPRNNVFIGDDVIADVHFAKSSGVRSVWFNTRNEIIEHKIEPDLEIKELTQLISYF